MQVDLSTACAVGIGLLLFGVLLGAALTSEGWRLEWHDHRDTKAALREMTAAYTQATGNPVPRQHHILRDWQRSLNANRDTEQAKVIPIKRPVSRNGTQATATYTVRGTTMTRQPTRTAEAQYAYDTQPPPAMSDAELHEWLSDIGQYQADAATGQLTRRGEWELRWFIANELSDILGTDKSDAWNETLEAHHDDTPDAPVWPVYHPMEVAA